MALTWVQALSSQPGPVPRSYHSTTLVGNKLFVLGGTSQGSQVQHDLWTLELDTLQWNKAVTTGAIPSARCSHSATVVGKNLIVFGGAMGQKPMFNDTFSLDTETMEWSKPPPSGTIPSPRCGHSANSIGGVILVFGGAGEGSIFNGAYVLDPNNYAWSQPRTTGKPPARAFHTANQYGRSLFVFGGFGLSEDAGGGVMPFNDLHVLDMTAGKMSWSNPTCYGSVPKPRHGHSSNIIGQNLVVYGGADAGTRVSEVLKLNLDSLTWTAVEAKGSMPTGRDFHTATTVNDKIFVFGGTDAANSYQNDVHVLSLEGTLWKTSSSVVADPGLADLLEQTTSKCKQLESQLATERAAHLAAQNELQEAVGRETYERNRKLQLEQELERRTLQSSDTSDENMSKLTEAQSQLSKQFEEISNLRATIEDLTTKNAFLEKEKADLTQSSEQTKLELANREVRTAELEQKLEEGRALLTKTLGECDSYKAEIGKLQSQIEELNRDLEAAANPLESSFTKDIESELREQLSAAQTSNLRFESKVRSLEEELSSIKASRLELINDLETLEREKEIAEEQLSVARRDLDSLEMQKASADDNSRHIAEEKEEISHKDKLKLEKQDSLVRELKIELEKTKRQFMEKKSDLERRVVSEENAKHFAEESQRLAQDQMERLRESVAVSKRGQENKIKLLQAEIDELRKTLEAGRTSRGEEVEHLHQEIALVNEKLAKEKENRIFAEEQMDFAKQNEQEAQRLSEDTMAWAKKEIEDSKERLQSVLEAERLARRRAEQEQVDAENKLSEERQARANAETDAEKLRVALNYQSNSVEETMRYAATQEQLQIEQEARRKADAKAQIMSQQLGQLQRDVIHQEEEVTKWKMKAQSMKADVDTAETQLRQILQAQVDAQQNSNDNVQSRLKILQHKFSQLQGVLSDELSSKVKLVQELERCRSELALLRKKANSVSASQNSTPIVSRTNSPTILS